MASKFSKNYDSKIASIEAQLLEVGGGGEDYSEQIATINTNIATINTNLAKKLDKPTTTYESQIATINTEVAKKVNKTDLASAITTNSLKVKGLDVQLVEAGDKATYLVANLKAGMMIFDTVLNKPLWRNKDNTGWVDATGTLVE